MEREKVLRYLEKAGLPAFPLDVDNFPLPGPIVRYYREQMRYTDPHDRKVKHWTQADLAQRLGLAPLMVRRMETQNKGLDSMDRRKTLSILLNIPPVLLGLASFDDLVSMLNGGKLNTSTRIVKGIGNEEIQLYKDALRFYKNDYEKGCIKASIPTLESWIGRIDHTVKQVGELQQKSISTILCKYHMLAADIYMHDIVDNDKAATHLNAATLLANTLNKDLQAAVHYKLGELYLTASRNPLMARGELDIALALSKDASSQTRGCVLSYAALSYAMTATDRANALYVQNLLDEAEKYISSVAGTMKFTTITALEERADTLITLGKYPEAQEVLDTLAEYSNNSERERRYVNILQAECLIKQSKPKYDIATFLLQDVLTRNRNKPIQYHVQYVDRLYTLLVQSSYGNSPDVADIGMLLRELR